MYRTAVCRRKLCLLCFHPGPACSGMGEGSPGIITAVPIAETVGLHKEFSRQCMLILLLQWIQKHLVHSGNFSAFTLCSSFLCVFSPYIPLYLFHQLPLYTLARYSPFSNSIIHFLNLHNLRVVFP